MPRSNYFNFLSSLSFDPAETNQGVIDVAIDNFYNGARVKRSSGADEAIKARGTEEMNLVPDMRKVMVVGSLDYIQEAEGKKQENARQLKSIADMHMKIAGSTIREESLNHYVSRLQLSYETIKDVFASVGVFPDVFDTDKDLPKYCRNGKEIHDSIKNITNQKVDCYGDPIPDMVDLYDFALYLQIGDKSTASEYSNMPVKELKRLYAEKALDISDKDDIFYGKLGEVCGFAEDVFSSQKEKDMYDRWIPIAKLKNRKEFSGLDTMSEEHKRTFAKDLIDLIMTESFTLHEAVALYNKEFAKLNPPYIPPPEPEKITIQTLTCSVCNVGKIVFADKKDVYNEVCPVCNSSFYIKCPKCGGFVSRLIEVCPEKDCGFNFKDMLDFNKYMAEARAALVKADHVEARACLSKLSSVDPSRKKEINKLTQDILQDEIITNEKIEDIETLIEEKRFRAAQSKIDDLRRRSKEIPISSEIKVRNKLKRLDDMYEESLDKTELQHENVCVVILAECIDYSEAEDFLQRKSPEPCTWIEINPDPVKGQMNISWGTSPSYGVTYLLVKKMGDLQLDIPNNITTETSYEDTQVTPGVYYDYSVFACRGNNISRGIGKKETLLCEVKNERVTTEDNTCTLFWDLPENCIGVSIDRTCDKRFEKQEKFDATNTSFSDSQLEYGKEYDYIIKALYYDCVSTKGITLTVKPIRKVETFFISYRRKKAYLYEISWDSKQIGLHMRILAKGSKKGAIFKSQDSVKSDVGSTILDLSKYPDDSYEVVVEASSGGPWISSNTLTIRKRKMFFYSPGRVAITLLSLIFLAMYLGVDKGIIGGLLENSLSSFIPNRATQFLIALFKSFWFAGLILLLWPILLPERYRKIKNVANRNKLFVVVCFVLFFVISNRASEAEAFGELSVNVLPRTAQLGSNETISVEITFGTDRFVWGVQQVSFSFTDKNGEEIKSGSESSLFLPLVGNTHVTLFTHTFPRGSIYTLKTFINGKTYERNLSGQ